MRPSDSHDLIRVHGARENNLKSISVELPKRRLTVFTGVSGSGKSSLVFATIAAKSQRLINETYSAFLQGLMPSQARPDVDVPSVRATGAITVEASGSSWPSRWAPTGTSTCSTSQPRACISQTSSTCSGCSTGWWTGASR